MTALATLPEVDIHFGRFLAKTAWRPLANLPVADRRIESPRPVTLPQGDHPVLGARPQTLPVGHYPDRRGERGGAPREARVPLRDAVIAEFHTMEEKGSDVNLAAHLLNDAWQESVRGGSGSFERHRSGRADPYGHGGTETAGLRRVPGPVAGRAAIEASGESCPAHPSRDFEGGAVSGDLARDRRHKAGGLVAGGRCDEHAKAGRS